MEEETQRPVLQLVDTPISRTIWMLRHLPLSSVVDYLEFIADHADHLGLLSKADRERITQLIQRISHQQIDRAA